MSIPRLMLAAQRLAPRSRVAACAVRTEVSTVLPVACQRLTTQASWRITNTLASDCAPSTSGRPFSGSSAWHSRSTSRRYRMANASVGSLPQSHRGQAELSTSGTPGPNPEPDVNKPSLVSKYCRHCGGAMHIARPESEKEYRHVCTACGTIEYFNPKMVVGCIVTHPGPGPDAGKVLLCRRAIQPCIGKWTVPAGYMELAESSAEGAARETWEEACAQVKIIAPYAHWDIPAIGQAYVLFRAHLQAPFAFGPGQESLETALFDPKDIPYEDLAFSSVALALRFYLQDLEKGSFRIHHGVIDKRAGSPGNDPSTYVLRDHLQFSVMDS